MRAHIDPKDAKGGRSTLQTLDDVIDILMMMTVDYELDAKCLGELVDRLPTMRMCRRCFVRHQDVGGPVPQQLPKVARENAGAVPASNAGSASGNLRIYDSPNGLD